MRLNVEAPILILKVYKMSKNKWDNFKFIYTCGFECSALIWLFETLISVAYQSQTIQISTVSLYLCSGWSQALPLLNLRLTSQGLL